MARTARKQERGNVVASLREFKGEFRKVVEDLQHERDGAVARVEELEAEVADLLALLGDLRNGFRAAVAKPAAAQPTTPRKHGRASGATPKPARATAEGVTPHVVATILAKLGGEATASQVAAEINNTGLKPPVSGRAIRHFARSRDDIEMIVPPDGGSATYRIVEPA